MTAELLELWRIAPGPVFRLPDGSLRLEELARFLVQIADEEDRGIVVVGRPGAPPALDRLLIRYAFLRETVRRLGTTGILLAASGRTRTVFELDEKGAALAYVMLTADNKRFIAGLMHFIGAGEDDAGPYAVWAPDEPERFLVGAAQTLRGRRSIDDAQTLAAQDLPADDLMPSRAAMRGPTGMLWRALAAQMGSTT